MTTLTSELAKSPAQSSKDLVDATFSKVAWRIVPLVFFAYVLNFIDRINIGYAQLQMKQDLGFTDAVYGLGAGLFFIGYFLFEVPSNMLLDKVGARKTMLRIMLLWGVTSAGTMFVSTPMQFYVARFLLGVFEAGFVPGILLYLTFWFPSGHRARIVAFFMSAVVIAGLMAGPISGWIMKDMNGMFGLEGWQWMFLIEGLPSAVFGVFLYNYLDDTPEDAQWLTSAERQLIISSVQADQKTSDASHQTMSEAFSDWRVYLLAFVYFSLTCGGYVITFWLPTMIKELGVTDVLHIGLYAAIPYGVAAVAMVLWARHSDFTLERRWHFAVPAILGSLALMLSTVMVGNFWVSMLLLIVATAGIVTPLPVFWSIPTALLSRTATAAGIAIITSIGGLSGAVSPYVLGQVKTYTGSLSMGIYAMICIVLIGVLTVLLAFPARILRNNHEC